MLDMLQREWVYLRYYLELQFRQIAPYYALGMVLGSVISVFGKARIHRLFATMGTKKWGALGVIPASALGIASPLCMYGTIPLAASFSRLGIKDDWLAAFMMSSILLNPQLIIYSAALGGTALTVRIISCFICGMAAGLLIRMFYKDKPFFCFDGFAEPPSRDTDPNIWLRLLKNIGRNIKATAGWFLIGLGLSALFTRYVPAGLIDQLFGARNDFGIFLAATIGVPLYACGGATIPLLQEWLWSGMSMGSAAAFMLTGPATKITNLGAVKIVLGMKRFVLYILYVIAFALISGLLVDAV